MYFQIMPRFEKKLPFCIDRINLVNASVFSMDAGPSGGTSPAESITIAADTVKTISIITAVIINEFITRFEYTMFFFAETNFTVTAIIKKNKVAMMVKKPVLPPDIPEK